LLVEESENRTNILRFDAAVAIWRIKGPSPVVLATFDNGLHNLNIQIRELALARLSDLSIEFPEAVPVLLNAMNDPDRLVRWWAVESITPLGTNAWLAMAKVRLLENDASPMVRFAATQALQAIQGNAYPQALKP
jgi:HEAT repeat protein